MFSGFTKRCMFDTINVAIARDMLPTSKSENFQLDDPNCIANLNKTHFFLNVKRGKCGTLSKSTGGEVEISNTIYYRVNGMEIFNVPLKCKYKEKVGSSASRSLFIANHRRFVSVTISRNYYLNKKVIFDSNFADFFPAVPLDIQAVEINGNLDILVRPMSSSLSFIVDHCKVKPSLSSKTKIVLVENE